MDETRLERDAVVTLDEELVDDKGVFTADEVVVTETLLEMLVEMLLDGGTAIETGDELDDIEDTREDAKPSVLL